MPRIPRVSQKIFASDSGANDVMQFGSLAAFNPVPTKDASVIQALSAFSEGWQKAVVLESSPTWEDFNALFLLVTQQLAYVLQEGIPEWDADTVYYKGSIVKVGDDAKQFRSIVDDNVGNETTDDLFWSPVGGSGGVPLGTIIDDAGAIPEDGWVDCDGETYLIASYEDAYARIGDEWANCINTATGVAYANPDEGYFRVPDFRGVHRRTVGQALGGVDVTLGGFIEQATAKNGLVNSSSTVTGTATQGATAALGGNHTHTNGGTATQGSTASTGGTHNHIMVGSAGRVGGGTNNFDINVMTKSTVDNSQSNPSTGASGAHSHSLSGSTAGGGAHSHALSATAAAQVISSSDTETRVKSVGVYTRIKLF